MSEIELPVRRWTRGAGMETVRDRIALERSVEIVALPSGRQARRGGVSIATVQCLPRDLEDLAVGFLLAEGLAENARAIGRVELSMRAGGDDAEGDDAEGDDGDGEGNAARAPFRVDVEIAGAEPDDLAARARGFALASGCGKALFAPQILRLVRQRMAASCPGGARGFGGEEILAAVRDVERRGELFRATGCVHAAAAWRAGDAPERNECVAFREDIGRHNAVNKVAGAVARAGPSADSGSGSASGSEAGVLGGCLVVSTGRLSADIAAKCVRLGAWGVASRSAATDRAIRIAAEFGLVLVGFARGNRMNVYCGGERLTE